MGLEKLIKREITLTISVVILVTTVFLMFSYSIFKVETTGETNVVKFGDLSLSFCKDAASCNETIENMGNIIGTVAGSNGTQYVPIYPQKDPSTTAEWNTLTPYTFKLTNTGSLPIYLSLHLEKDETQGLSYTTDREVNGSTYTETFTSDIDDAQIKVAIGERGSTPTIKLYSETVNGNGEHVLVENLYMDAGTSKIFNLYAWLKEDAINASQGKYFVTLITARGEYLPTE